MAPSKFQPLSLTPVNFSLTEGTSIPAPPDSPPETPRPPTPGKGPLSSHPTPKSETFPKDVTEQPKASTDSTADSAQLAQITSHDGGSSTLLPSSPTATSKRPSSVRKFLGLRPLSSSDSLKADRPGSPAAVNNTSPNLGRKKSAGWFGKRKSAMIISPVLEGKENSLPSSNGHAPQPEKKGPPPPTLPSLSFGPVSEESSANLGAEELFKDIK